MLKKLTQQSYPRLWLVFQALFGATRDKQRIALSFLSGRKQVLEIGCSLGVVSAVFREKASICYLGIDIDEQAIRYAQKRFEAYPHMQFATQSLEALVKSGRRFDYVLFANILHHVDDELATVLLRYAFKAMSGAGVIVLMEPDVLHPDDGLLVRALYQLERGQFRRPLKDLIALAEGVGIRITEAGVQDISIGLLPGIIGGHMLVLSGIA